MNSLPPTHEAEPTAQSRRVMRKTLSTLAGLPRPLYASCIVFVFVFVGLLYVTRPPRGESLLSAQVEISPAAAANDVAQNSPQLALEDIHDALKHLEADGRVAGQDARDDAYLDMAARSVEQKLQVNESPGASSGPRPSLQYTLLLSDSSPDRGRRLLDELCQRFAASIAGSEAPAPTTAASEVFAASIASLQQQRQEQLAAAKRLVQLLSVLDGILVQRDEAAEAVAAAQLTEQKSRPVREAGNRLNTEEPAAGEPQRPKVDDTATNADPYRALANRLDEARNRREDLLRRRTAMHPEVVKLDNEIVQLEEQLQRPNLSSQSRPLLDHPSRNLPSLDSPSPDPTRDRSPAAPRTSRFGSRWSEAALDSPQPGESPAGFGRHHGDAGGVASVAQGETTREQFAHDPSERESEGTSTNAAEKLAAAAELASANTQFAEQRAEIGASLSHLIAQLEAPVSLALETAGPSQLPAPPAAFATISPARVVGNNGAAPSSTMVAFIFAVALVVAAGTNYAIGWCIQHKTLANRQEAQQLLAATIIAEIPCENMPRQSASGRWMLRTSVGFAEMAVGAFAVAMLVALLHPATRESLGSVSPMETVFELVDRVVRL